MLKNKQKYKLKNIIIRHTKLLLDYDYVLDLAIRNTEFCFMHNLFFNKNTHKII